MERVDGGDAEFSTKITASCCELGDGCGRHPKADAGFPLSIVVERVDEDVLVAARLACLSVDAAEEIGGGGVFLGCRRFGIRWFLGVDGCEKKEGYD